MAQESESLQVPIAAHGPSSIELGFWLWLSPGSGYKLYRRVLKDKDRVDIFTILDNPMVFWGKWV